MEKIIDKLNEMDNKLDKIIRVVDKTILSVTTKKLK